jgi:hypothetical protein
MVIRRYEDECEWLLASDGRVNGHVGTVVSQSTWMK